MTGTYHSLYVMLSVLIVIVASYVAFNLLERIPQSKGLVKKLWIMGSSITMGIGIWSMHFTGMLAFQLPIPVSYHIGKTLLSLLFAIVASLTAFVTAIISSMNRVGKISISALLMGGAIVSMHYMGITAMEMKATIHYDLFYLFLSFFVAVVVSAISLYILFYFQQAISSSVARKLIASVIIGLGVASMHYTGMKATSFRFDPTKSIHAHVIHSADIGTDVFVLTFMLLLIALVFSWIDQQIAIRAARWGELRYKSLFEHNTDGIFTMDRNGNFLGMNPAAERITGHSAEELLHASFPSLVESEELEKIWMYFRQALQGETQVFEATCVCKNGDRRTLLMKMIPMIRNQEMIGVYGIAKDITNQKKAEKRILESELRYRQLVEHSPEGVVVHREGKIIYANPAAMKFMKEDQPIGKSIFQFIHPDFHEISKQRVSDIQRIGEELPVAEMKFIRKDGKIIYAEVSGIAIMYDGIPSILALFKDITERKQAEQALQESEERYRRLVEKSPEPILVHREGKISFANLSFLKLIGATRMEELVGKHVIDFVHPEYKGLVENRLVQLNQEGKSVDFIEEKILGLDGTEIDVEVTGITIYEQGKPAVLTIVHNITRRKKAEKALRESEAKYRLIAENMRDLIVVIGMDGIVKYASPSYKTVLGIDPEEYVGQHSSILIHPDDMERLREAVVTVITEKIPVKLDSRVKEWNEENQYLFFEIDVLPILGINNQVEGISGISRDITKRYLAEKSLRESEEKYRLIADHSQDMIKLIDENGYIIYASPSHQAILGLAPEEYIGTHVLERIHPSDRSLFQEQLYRCIHYNESFRMEFRKQNKQGQWIWLEAVGTLVLNEQGYIKHIVLMTRNIMERKQYEAKLEYMAYHDSLTGLPNRRFFMQLLEQAMKEAKRYQKKMAVMFMDLDKFKWVNDTLGHDVGDVLLKQFAQRLRNCLRESDIIARLGGDEFTILLPEIQFEEDAINTAERIIEALQEPWEIGEHTFQTTSSIGISLYPRDGQDPKLLVKRADIALYNAKEQGRNNYQFFVHV